MGFPVEPEQTRCPIRCRLPKGRSPAERPSPRGGAWRWRRAGATGALALFAVLATAQECAPADVSNQLWGNVVLGHPKSPRLYYELDLEPKFQVSGGEPWRNVDATPLVELYPHSLVDLTGEVTVGRTRQTEADRSWELTPRIGLRLHLFKRLWDEIDLERLPLSRLSLANLFRLELRNLWYSGDRVSSHEMRFRNRTELKVAINNDTLSVDRTLYLFADVEFFVPLGEDIPERFATKSRIRTGLGYRLSRKWRFEALYIRDFARETLDEEVDIEMNALDLRLKVFP
jgi:hypothetical protein